MITHAATSLSPLTDRQETWDPRLTYVVGHRRPDTDAIA
jgi:hypothetical protein